MKFAIIIPSRYDSTRLPGKPLKLISGKSLINRVWDLAKAVNLSGHELIVKVATDDERIAEHVASFDGEYILTNPECRNGSERVYEAYTKLASEGVKIDVLINLQGDAVLTPPWIIQAICESFIINPNTNCATPAVAISPEKVASVNKDLANGIISGTHVVCNKAGEALYFSRYPIPFLRKSSDTLPVYKHIGLYAYTPNTLEAYIKLAPCELENIEGLEQLRFLYHGIPIQVVEVDYQGRSHCGIDTIEDAIKAEEIINREGELI